VNSCVAALKIAALCLSLLALVICVPVADDSSLPQPGRDYEGIRQQRPERRAAERLPVIERALERGEPRLRRLHELWWV
jgi:hypothetical protein